MRIMTCNLRGNFEQDGDDAWPGRKKLCCEVIRRHPADIVCFQELVRDLQYDDIQNTLEGYESYGVSDGPRDGRPLNSIFFRRNSFQMISASAFWLSETPHIPWSTSWGSCCVRFACWVELLDLKSDKSFVVINTHLDHICQEAREGQVGKINEWASAWPEEYPQILTGDMNSDRANSAIEMFKQNAWRDSYEESNGPEEPGLTFHAFKGDAFVSEIGKMDWIFARGNLNSIGSTIIKDSQNGHYPSDHYFVAADFELQ